MILEISKIRFGVDYAQSWYFRYWLSFLLMTFVPRKMVLLKKEDWGGRSDFKIFSY